MKKSIVFFIITFFAKNAWAQELNINLQLKEYYTQVLKKEYLPHIILDTNITKCFVPASNDSVTYFQYYFRYNNEENLVLLDTLNVALYDQPNVGRIVIIDTDKNYDFRNDKKILFTKEIRSDFLKLPVRKDSFNNGNNLEKKFKLVAYIDYDGLFPVEKFKLVENWLYEGDFKLRDIEGKVLVYDRYSNSKEKRIFFHLKTNRKNYPPLILGDSILLDNQIYTTHGDLNTIYFTKTKNIEYSFFPAIEYVTKRQLHPKDFKGKYLLIDFWGSWCAPCIQGIPDIARILKKYNEKLEVISIAYERNSDLSQLDKIIKDNNMYWNHLYFLRNEKDPIKNGSKYLIKSFPTFLLIDPEGKVMAREEGKKGISKIEEILERTNLEE